MLSLLGLVKLTRCGSMYVDNQPLREALESSTISLCSVARQLGWMNRTTGKPDATRLQRRLGMKPDRTTKKSGGVKYYNKRVSYEFALQLVEILDIDPVEVGL